MSNFKSTKLLELGSCAFRQPNAVSGNRNNAGENSSRCSKLHGYKLTAKFVFSCSSLDDKHWVADFGGFGPIKEIFKHQFDHTTCISCDDPLLDEFKKLHDLGGLDLRVMPKGTGIERIAEWCFEQMSKFISTETDERVWLESAEVFEHENNSAIYQTLCQTITVSPPLDIIWDKNCNPIDMPSEQSPVADTITEILDVKLTDTPIRQNKQGAAVGQKPTSGLENMFKGTMFG